METTNKETLLNLARSFAGESQARTRYTVYAQVARKEGYEWIARVFEETAANEAVHAEEFLEKLVELGLNGIEVNHPSMTEEATRDAEEAARKVNLYRSGGTDHTGPMSACGGKYAIPVCNGISEEDFMKIYERRLG